MYKKYMVSQVYREIASPTRLKRGQSLMGTTGINM